LSTHGVVAVGTIANWRGVYNNSDSHPTSLGKGLRENLIGEIASGNALKDVGERILAFDDWNNYLNGGICPYCGKLASQPNSMSTDLVMGGGSSGEFPDPDCLRHEHEPLGDFALVQYTGEDLDDDSDIEWIYIINVQARVIHVIDNREEYGRNLHVGDISLRGAEPNYEHLECGDGFSRCDCLAWAHFDEINRDGPQSRLTTKQYLGLLPVGRVMYDAVAVIIKGERFQWSGMAFGEGGFHFTKPRPKLDTRIQNALHAELAIDGGMRWVPVGVQKGCRQKPAPGVAWVFPATKVMPEFAVLGG